MVDRFLEFIKKHALIEDGDRLLLAVSGGVDSMTLLKLFSQAKYSFAVAHCNFQLRGEEADLDEQLVKVTCEELGVVCHTIRFQTKEYATKNGVSTQMAARELRYSWFEELSEEYLYDKVVLAHHRDDSIETFFLNLTRGTSLRGLRGIQPRNESLIRPLLLFSKEEISKFAKNEGLKWREDASNQETYYKRNLVRHELLPLLKKMNPDFENIMTENLEKLNLRYYTSEQLYESLRKKLIKPKGGRFEVLKAGLIENCNSAYDFYEVLREFNFNYDTCKQLFQALENVGAVFYSEGYSLSVDRDYLLIDRLEEASLPTLSLEKKDSSFSVQGVNYSLSIISKGDWRLDKNIANGAFDLGLLKFPLLLRPWQHGDQFQPLGMQGRKLVSDFLIDQKVPLADKPKVYVLVSDNEIVWVVGLRVSEKFKVADKTEKVLELRQEVH